MSTDDPCREVFMHLVDVETAVRKLCAEADAMREELRQLRAIIKRCEHCRDDWRAQAHGMRDDSDIGRDLLEFADELDEALNPSADDANPER